MTVELCASLTFDSGYSVFGLQYGSECYGSNDLPTALSIGSNSACTTPCAGNSAETCGGNWTNNVYTFKAPAFMNAGCFWDSSTSGRRIPNRLPSSFPMTVELCSSLAFSAGYSVFGVQYGSECYGSNDLQIAQSIGSSSNCAIPCAGNSAETCGGNWANNVFFFPPPPPPPVVIVQPLEQCGGTGGACKEGGAEETGGDCFNGTWAGYACPSGYICARSNDYWWGCFPAPSPPPASPPPPDFVSSKLRKLLLRSK